MLSNCRNKNLKIVTEKRYFVPARVYSNSLGLVFSVLFCIFHFIFISLPYWSPGLASRCATAIITIVTLLNKPRLTRENKVGLKWLFHAAALQPRKFERDVPTSIKKRYLGYFFFCKREDGTWKEGRNEREKERERKKEVKVPREWGSKIQSSVRDMLIYDVKVYEQTFESSVVWS